MAPFYLCTKIKTSASKFGSRCVVILHFSSQDLLQLCKARQRIFLGGSRLALNQRQHIIDEGFLDAISCSIDPLAGNFLFDVGHIGKVDQLGWQVYLPFSRVQAKATILSVSPETACSTAVRPAIFASSISVREAK